MLNKLSKMSIRKISVATFTLIVLFSLYFIPNKEKEVVIENNGIEYVYSNVAEVIYLLDSNDYIARTKINSCKCEGMARAKDLIEGLIIDGSKSNIIPNGFRSIIPSGTTILDVTLDDEILTVNFSKELLDINAKYEEKMIEALTYTLTSIDGIKGLIIKVEGNLLTNLPNNKKELPDILTKEYGINKSYELSTLKNIDSFTVYYVNSYNDSVYYVPVTKYINNDNQDKIKVIIEQLSTSPIYESNLMSFLSVSTKLLDYELNEETIKLNFNQMILNDITSNNILEEVIYTISLSLNDLYPIKEVVFLVENEEIYKTLIKDIE